MGAGLWLASPLSKPATQTTIGSLFDMVPVGLEPLTRLLGLIGYLGVVSWSIGKVSGPLYPQRSQCIILCLPKAS